MERQFFNGDTGRQEVWLERHVSRHELHGRSWTEEHWVVASTDAEGYRGMGEPYPSYSLALADYEARVAARMRGE